MLPALEVCPLTTSLEQGKDLPWAVRYQRCKEGVDLCYANKQQEKFNAVCWVERKDIEKPNFKYNVPKGQASWHPGWRHHQLSSRKSVLIFLKAFQKAFDIWEEGIGKDGFPLKESYWHIGEIYKDMQNTLRTYINGEGKGTSLCEKHYEQYGFDKWCRTRMRGMSEFSPRNLGYENSISKRVKPAASGYVPGPLFTNAYVGPDILPLGWKIPEGHVDLHAIAVVTNYEAPQIDHFWEYEGDDDTFEEDAENSRRQLGNAKEVVSTEGNLDTAAGNLNDVPRALASDDVVPGEGWGFYLRTADNEYCDGSANSECDRIVGNSQCFYYGANDSRNGISGDGLSGWIVINVPEVKEGIVWAKLEWWHPRKDWHLTPLNEDGNRKLGNIAQNEYPDDFKFDIAVNGKIVDTWDKEKFMSHAYPEMAYNNAFFPLVTDESLRGPVELGLRVSSTINPKVAGLTVTHIYWA